MAKPTPDHFALVGTLFEQKFRIDDVVAEGGFGVVYRAVQAHLDRPVALKVLKLPPDLDEPSRTRVFDGFNREARAILKVNHPNIVQVLDFGISVMPDGRRSPWMALEWLDGVTLRKDLHGRRHSGGRTPSQVLALLRPVLEALAYTHDAGIAHRDLKPANLMIVQTRRGKELKLLDFGIAKLMEENEEPGSGDTATLAQFTAFSLNYAAPEQISGMRTGPWTDVHAMGLILTELLVDQPPYGAGDRAELYAKIMSDRRPTPARFDVDVGAWEPVLAKAVAVRPADRYKNAAELLEALWQNLAGAVAISNRGHAGGAAPGPTDPPSHPSSDPVAFRVLTPPTARAPRDLVQPFEPQPPRDGAAVAVAVAAMAPDGVWAPKTRPAGSGGISDFVAVSSSDPAGHDLSPATPREVVGSVESEEHGITTLRGATTTTGRTFARSARARWIAAVAVAGAVVSVGAWIALRGPSADRANSDANRSGPPAATTAPAHATTAAAAAAAATTAASDGGALATGDADARSGGNAGDPGSNAASTRPGEVHDPRATPPGARSTRGASRTTGAARPTVQRAAAVRSGATTRTTRTGTPARGPTGNETLPVD